MCHLPIYHGSELVLLLYSVYRVSAAVYDIPGVIEAEEFDEGGQGVGYYDTTTGNLGDDVRDETFVVNPSFRITNTTSKNIRTRIIGPCTIVASIFAGDGPVDIY